MGAQRSSFEKLQRDRAKKAKASAKRERRLDKTETDETEDAPLAPISSEGEISASDLLREIERIQRQFDDEEIDFEEYEEKKIELLARLPID